MKLEEAKKLQGVFKSNLNKISRERYKSKEQPSALENIKLRYELQEAVIKLLNYFFNCILGQRENNSWQRNSKYFSTRRLQ